MERWQRPSPTSERYHSRSLTRAHNTRSVVVSKWTYLRYIRIVSKTFFRPKYINDTCFRAYFYVIFRRRRSKKIASGTERDKTLTGRDSGLLAFKSRQIPNSRGVFNEDRTRVIRVHHERVVRVVFFSRSFSVFFTGTNTISVICIRHKPSGTVKRHIYACPASAPSR